MSDTVHDQGAPSQYDLNSNQIERKIENIEAKTVYPRVLPIVSIEVNSVSSSFYARLEAPRPARVMPVLRGAGLRVAIVREHASARPTTVAVRQGDRELTYAMLDER